MINTQNVKNNFLDYVSLYDSSNEKIKLKIDHILRVADISKNIAKNLNLSDEDINLAYSIGIFHDISRFEQVKRFNTFNDSKCNIDHGKFSNDILFQNNFIREFIADDSYDEIIKKAIYNHNKLIIEENLTEKELLFSKIIRDADKIDIIYTTNIYSYESIFWYDDFDIPKINEKLIENFSNTSLLEYKYVKNNADQVLCFFSYIYDLNFNYSKKFLLEKEYFDKFIQTAKNVFKSKIIHEQLDYILSHAKNYLKE